MSLQTFELWPTQFTGVLLQWQDVAVVFFFFQKSIGQMQKPVFIGKK